MMRSTHLRAGAALTVACAMWAAGCSDGIGPEDPLELVFVAAPLSLSEADVLAPAVAVAVRDSRGNTVEWPNIISLTLEGSADGGALEGTRGRTARGGIAIFDDLRISTAGTGYRLVARTGKLADAVSEPFDVHAVFTGGTVTVGRWHTCALTADGVAYCWGDNSGQLGTGDTERRFVPTRVQTETRFSSISTLWGHTCAVSQDAEVFCWGPNEDGQVGDGSTVRRTVPTRVSLPGPALSVSAGAWSTCALLADRRAYCWGWNDEGALGIGVNDGSHASPLQVMGNHEWAKIQAGWLYACGLTAAGEAYCWGNNRGGATGVGVMEGVTYTPTAVVGGHRFADLVAGGGAGGGATCGVTTDGRILCWGRHHQWDGGWDNYSFVSEPKPVIGEPELVEVTLGPFTMCGFTANRKVYCVGRTPAHTPLEPDLRVASLALGAVHTCLITTDGETFCWGTNDRGQVGSGGGTPGWFVRRGVWAPPGG
jgi:alpha-tubulin suppressor-like RCC1 family protein